MNPYYNGDVLSHYGVKGMQWGVTRTKEQLGYRSYTPQKGDVTLDSGAKFQRITTSSNSGITKGVYTSYKNADKDLYKGVLGRMRISHLYNTGEDVALNEITMIAKKQVRLPSKQVRMTEFEKLYTADPQRVADFINDHEASRYGRREMKIDTDYFQKNSKELYQKFNDALAGGVDSKYGIVVKNYYHNLSKLGYDGIPDENDIRLSTFKAKAPIIMFDMNKSIGAVNGRELSASEVFNAYQRSIGKKTVRDILQVGSIGFEALHPDTEKRARAYAKQLEKDKFSLNSDYTLYDLAKDWRENRLTSTQIRKISDKMDAGKTHDEAMAEVIGVGNAVVDYFLDTLNI